MTRSTSCVLSFGLVGVQNAVFNTVVPVTREMACVDALEKIFQGYDPFTLDEKTGVWVPDLSDRSVRELKTFKEYRQDVFEQIFQPYVPTERIPLSRFALLLNT